MSKYYTDEQANFIKSNYTNYTFEELSDLFFEIFGVKKSASTLSKYCNSKGLVKTKRVTYAHNFSAEEAAFIIENHAKKSDKEVCDLFNKTFGTKISLQSYQSKKHRLGLTNKIHNFSEEENLWLKENFGKFSSLFMYDIFREKFAVSLSDSSIRKQILKLGIDTKRHVYTKEQNDFLKENVVYYTFPKLTEVFNKRFETNVSIVSVRGQCISYLNARRGKNAFSASTLPLGTEKIKNGMIYVKVSETPYKRNDRWIPKHWLIYKEHNGEIPNNYRIIFLDGNKMNLDVENLYAIPNKIHTMLNQNGWYINDRNSMIAKIKYCELFYKLKESEVK